MVLGIINDNFISAYAPYKIQLSEVNRGKRLKWIDEHENWRDWKWDRVVWTDEKIFALYPQGLKRRVKILFEEEDDDFSVAKVPQGGKKVMFWGAISSVGKVSLRTIKGKIDGKAYREFLLREGLVETRLVHGKSFIFQQDNAPAHRAKDTKLFLQDCKIEVLEWPPQSPDLNPIEQVWLWMAKKTNSRSFENIQELEDYVFELWEKIPKDTILAYIRKIPDKMFYIKNNNGDLYRDHK